MRKEEEGEKGMIKIRVGKKEAFLRKLKGCFAVSILEFSAKTESQLANLCQFR